MIKYIYFISIMILYSASSYSDNKFISQSGVSVTTDDIDGFAFKMPTELRAGFFESPERIDKTIMNLLTMKIVNKYAQDNNLIEMSEVNDTVKNKMNDIVSYRSEDDNYLKKEIEYKLIKKYVYIEEKYKYFQNYFRSTIKEDELHELANELYELNKESFYKEETRDIDYISFIYNENNKKQKESISKDIFNNLRSSKTTMGKIIKRFKNKDPDFESVKGFNNYVYNDRDGVFSEAVFKNKKLGLIESIVDVNNRYIILVINRINEAGYESFKKVKGSIIAKLKEEKTVRDYNKLMLDLTGDKIEINELNIVSLRTRYEPITKEIKDE